MNVSVQGAELFGVEATYGGGTISQSASSLPDLVDSLINNQEAFTPLAGNDFSANVTYYGVPDALNVSVVGDTQLTITSPLTGLNQTFTGTDRSDLEDQLTDWLLENGTEEVAKLMQATAEVSAATLIDGNPGSATARMSSRAFETFSFYSPSPAMRGTNGGTHGGLQILYGQSRADTPSGTVDGYEAELLLPWWAHLSKHVSLIGNILGRYGDSEGTEVYGVGGDLGLGIRPFARAEDEVFGWQITPFAGLHGVGSYDGAMAGLLDQFGISNRFEFHFASDVTLVFASQYAHYDSLKLEIESVKIDPDLNQQVVKNGLMIDGPVTPVPTMYLNAFVMDTRFLENVAVDAYQTVGGGLAFRKPRSSIHLSFAYDVADLYEGWRAVLGFGWGH
jgi:hypothetical protein